MAAPVRMTITRFYRHPDGRPRAWTSLALAALIGAGFGMSFAPTPSWIAATLLLLALVGLVERVDGVRRAALIGWMFGLGWFVAGIHWLYISLHDYGEMAAPLAIAAVLALSAYLALFPALAAAAFAWVRPRVGLAWRGLGFAIAWTVTEWLRGVLFTGFPWIATGYAHVDGPLAGVAPIGGIGLVTFVAAWSAAELAISAVPVQRLVPSLPGEPRVMLARPQIRPRAVGAVILAFIVAAGLRVIDWTSPLGAPLTVRLAQGNVPQDTKFDPATLQQQFEIYDELRRSGSAELIALPETAYPVELQDWPVGHLERIIDEARASHAVVITGVPAIDPDTTKPLGGDWYNAAIAIGATGGPARYEKHHLVPFGEFVPTGFRWFVDAMVMPLGDFSRGAIVQVPFPVRDQRIGVNICYEDLFGDEIAASLRQPGPASVLLNLSNIAWFGDSAALPQHLAASRMRAIETGRPMLRATNTGMTAIIDARGVVVAKLAPFTRDVLAGTVQGMQGETPYVRVGDAGLGVVLLIALLALAFAARKTRYSHTPSPRSRASKPPLGSTRR